MCICTPRPPTGRNTILEMAEAGIARGYEYIAITDHSKNLAMVNGLDDQRALEHMKQIREVDARMEGRIRVLTGIEVDILGDGEIDLSQEVLAQMDVVIASVHSLFQQPKEQMTERLLKAMENPYIRILGHLTGRLLLRRDSYEMDLTAVLKQAAKLGVAVEHNAYPDRLDLVRHRLAPGSGTGLQHRDQYRLAPHQPSGRDALWNPAAATRVADESRRAEYAAGRGFSGGNCVRVLCLGEAWVGEFSGNSRPRTQIPMNCRPR